MLTLHLVRWIDTLNDDFLCDQVRSVGVRVRCTRCGEGDEHMLQQHASVHCAQSIGCSLMPAYFLSSYEYDECFALNPCLIGLTEVAADLLKKKQQKEQEKDETLYEKYLREKKQQKREQRKAKREEKQEKEAEEKQKLDGILFSSCSHT